MLAIDVKHNYGKEVNTMVRKIFITSAAAAMILAAPAAVRAANGDIAGTLYTTDILTEVDGKPIKSYSLDGETLIALEDLKDYGFEVYYNDNVRSVFVTRTGVADPSFSPYIERGIVGSTAGYYYESDIRAFVNGKEIEAYSLDGKMVAKVELIGTEYLDGSHPFYSSYSYDDSQRLLSLYTDPAEYSDFDMTLNSMFDTYTGLMDRKTYMHTDDFWFVNRFTGGLMGGKSMKNYHAVYNNGLMVDLSNIFRLYYINPGDFALAPDGETLYLSNKDIDGRVVDYKQVDLSNLHVFPADKSGFDTAAVAYSDTGYTYTLNGVEIPVYTIGCVDYLRLADFDKCGFICYTYDDKDLMTLTYSPDAEKGERPQKIVLNGTPQNNNTNLSIYINGTLCNPEDIQIIDEDLFIKAETLATPTVYGNIIFNPYINFTAQDEFRMLSDYSAENKTANLYYFTPNNEEINSYISLEYNRLDYDSYEQNAYFTIFKRKVNLGNNLVGCSIITISNKGIITDISSLVLKYFETDSGSINYTTGYTKNNEGTITVTCSNGKSVTIDPLTLQITE